MLPQSLMSTFTQVIAQSLGTFAPASTRPQWLVAAAVALVALGIVCASRPAIAQRSEGPSITVPPTIVAEPASQTALSIQVGPPERLPSNSFVRLRGLPASVSLTEGHAISPGLWAVPLVGLSALKAVVPAGITGRTEVIIHLVSVDGATLAETKTALVVGPANVISPGERPAGPPQRASSAVIAAPPPLPPAPKADRVPSPVQGPLLSGEAKERAERLVANGDRHLEQGNIGAARLFFQRASEAGFAAGALKMAATYDPAELQRLAVKVQGALPDRNEARKWYERARALGAPEAEERLARLGGS
jgi:hypothetical protein